MRNKELYFVLNSSGKRVSMKDYRKSPVDFNLFVEIISRLKNINIDNTVWLEQYYNKYINELFSIITSKNVKSYSKYFWNNECLGFNSSSVSDEYWLQRGWSNDELILKRRERYATGTVDFQKKKYKMSELEASEKLKARQFIIKTKRQKTYKKYLKEDPDYFKKHIGYSVDFFVYRGYSEEAAIKLSKKVGENVSKKFKAWAKNQSESNPIYWNSRTETQLGYWLAKGYNEKDAKLKLKDRQTTFSKEVCIKKYGEVEGLRVWQERQKLWKSKVFNDNQWLGGGVSKVSNELFEKIISLSNLKSVDTLYGIKNEKFISNNKTHYKYDFTYLPTKKIIEFNGDYWHCNPDLYKADYYHKIKKMTARKIWDYDNVKIATAKHHGYDILVIWEDDYRKEPNKVINKCINFLIN